VRKHIVLLLSLCSLVSCAASQERPAEDRYAGRSGASDCISQASIRDYKVLDDANLIVTSGVARKYHVALSRRAYGLRSATQIAFQSATGRVCERFSDIVTAGGFGPEKIRIESIQQLTPEDEEELLIRFGKKEPESEQPRQPVEVAGAEVEELD